MRYGLEYICKDVVEGVSLKDARAGPNHIIFAGRWVKAYTQDSENHYCNGRHVGQEANQDGDADAAFYAATPPLEAKRALFSLWANERTRDGLHLKIHLLDVNMAYFNGRPRRAMYIRRPAELGLGKDVVGRLRL